MFQRRVFLALGVAAGIGLALAASVSPVLAASYSVTISDLGFVPSTLTVATGDTIEFRNSTTSTQSARTTVASGFNTGDIGPNQSKSVVVSNIGSYTYSSFYNSSLTGTVEVTAAGSTSTTSATTTSATSTASGTKTGLPVETQPQPVSGVFEVVLAMMVGGTALVASGVVWQRRLSVTSDAQTGDVLISLPRITLTREQDPPQA